MIETDVLVAGAGPAGSSAAKHAAQYGAEVLLIDKKSVELLKDVPKVFPRMVLKN